jgi:hypothetical protein
MFSEKTREAIMRIAQGVYIMGNLEPKLHPVDTAYEAYVAAGNALNTFYQPFNEITAMTAERRESYLVTRELLTKAAYAARDAFEAVMEYES